MRYRRFVFVSGRQAEEPDDGFAGLALRFLINVAALWVSQAIIPGFDIEGWGPLLLGAAIFGGINALIKPVVTLLALPITCLTLGLFTLVINALMLALTAWIAGLFDAPFQVEGFWAAVFGALIISIVSTLLSSWLTTRVLGPLREGRSDRGGWR